MPLHPLTGRHAQPSPPDTNAAHAHDDDAAPLAPARHAANAAAPHEGLRASDASQHTRPSAARPATHNNRSAAREQAPRQPHRRPGRPTSQEQAGALDTREHILRQARGLFMQRGFADVSVGEVAELVGVTKPTLYYHFQSKQGLYTAALCDMMREVGGYIDEVVALDAPVRERLRLLAVGYLAHARMRIEPMLRDTFELIGQERAAEVIRAYHERLIAPIATLLRAGVASGEIMSRDLDSLTRAFLGLLDTFNDHDHERQPNRMGSASAHTPHPPRQPATTHAPTDRPAPRMNYNATSPAPSSEVAQLADLLVSLFMDGVATRPGV